MRVFGLADDVGDQVGFAELLRVLCVALEVKRLGIDGFRIPRDHESLGRLGARLLH